MKTYFNGQLQKNISDIPSLENLIEDLKIECKISKKILEIVIDEKIVERCPIGLAEKDINKVELTTKSPLELIIESMVEGVEYLPKLCLGLRKSVTMFQQANIGEGIDIFQKSIDGLTWLNQLLRSIEIYWTESELNVQGLSYQNQIERFDQVLRELLKAWENEDYILISDLLEYELIDVLEDWQSNFAQILDKLAGVQ